jgi:hypothetical protein
VGKGNYGMKSMRRRKPSKKVRSYECLQVIRKALLRYSKERPSIFWTIVVIYLYQWQSS